MTVMVRDRADARWAPARFNFALFRLSAFLIARRMQPKPQQGVVYIIDRNQNRFETYAVSVIVMAIIMMWTLALTGDRVGIAAALLLGVAAAEVFVHVILIGVGLIIGDADNTRKASVTAMAIMFIVAVMIARTQTWGRYVAMVFIALAILNTFASVILWLLQDAVASVNRARGAAQ